MAHPQPGTTALTTRSLKITSSNEKIEENPVLVQQGSSKRLTLFTSFGYFGQTGDTDYVTRYRQGSSLWKEDWLDKTPTRLVLPAGTAGQGNAQVIKDPDSSRWFIFFNGHAPSDYSGDGVGPKWLYLGRLGWNDAGKPFLDHMVSPG